MNANIKWNIEVTSDGRVMGDLIPATGWDVLSKLAAVKAAIPATWQAEAYPVVSATRTPDLASAPVAGMIYPPVAHSGISSGYPRSYRIRQDAQRLHVSQMAHSGFADWRVEL